MKEINDLNNNDLAELLEYSPAPDRCHRCSNYFWDGDQQGCHKNINNSNCIKGQKEWLESEPSDNLQIKYKKKYIYFGCNENAELARKLANILYSFKLITKSDSYCKNCPVDECVMSRVCFASWSNIIHMRNAYVKEEEAKTVYEYDAIKIKDHYSDLMTFISGILLPDIPDDAARSEAESYVQKIILNRTINKHEIKS